MNNWIVEADEDVKEGGSQPLGPGGKVRTVIAKTVVKKWEK